MVIGDSAASEAVRIVFGFHPVRELLRKQPQVVEELWCSSRPGKRRAEIEGLCQRHGIRWQNVAPGRLDELASRASHNGFAARCTRDPGAAAEGDSSGADSELVVLVEDIQDPRNLGALIRVCEGAGVGRLLIRDRGSAPLTALAARTSAGASEWLPVERVVNSAREIDRLKQEGYWVYGAAAEGVPPWDLDLTGPVVLCLGGEEKGLRARTRDCCDALVGLPMRGRVASLNLSTAASALLYEAVRQRVAEESSKAE